jgi:8-oxo-dGTP pyrophosphatase MutT (NUDIX family)
MFDRENSGCTIVENGKLLTLHRVERKHLEIPGGGVEPGETLAQAAARETNRKKKEKNSDI